jgi:hypothetical protein
MFGVFPRITLNFDEQQNHRVGSIITFKQRENHLLSEAISSSYSGNLDLYFGSIEKLALILTNFALTKQDYTS